jgi:hypothetical protein
VPGSEPDQPGPGRTDASTVVRLTCILATDVCWDVQVSGAPSVEQSVSKASRAFLRRLTATPAAPRSSDSALAVQHRSWASATWAPSGRQVAVDHSGRPCCCRCCCRPPVRLSPTSERTPCSLSLNGIQPASPCVIWEALWFNALRRNAVGSRRQSTHSWLLSWAQPASLPALALWVSAAPWD